MPLLIDGLKYANQLKEQMAPLTESFFNITERKPCLSVISIGHNPANTIFIHLKKKEAEKLGFKFINHSFSDLTSQKIIEEKIINLNQDSTIDGIILQLPIPKQYDLETLISLITPHKDVDGLHPHNLGKLTAGFPTTFIPCAPQASLLLLKSIQPILESLTVGIIGSSSLIGRPMTMLMANEDSTVWLANIKTKNLPELCQIADILIVGIGSPNFIQGNWIKKDAIIIDIGINKLLNGTIVGDVDFNSAQKQAKAITPVPGGVGPMTVALLLQNTLKAAYLNNNITFPEITLQ